MDNEQWQEFKAIYQMCKNDNYHSINIASKKRREAIKAAYETLQTIEWVSPPWPTFPEDGQEPFCPWCGRRRSEEHREDCMIGMVINE